MEKKEDDDEVVEVSEALDPSANLSKPTSAGELAPNIELLADCLHSFYLIDLQEPPAHPIASYTDLLLSGSFDLASPVLDPNYTPQPAAAKKPPTLGSSGIAIDDPNAFVNSMFSQMASYHTK